MNNIIYKLSSSFLTNKENLASLNNEIPNLYNFYFEASQKLNYAINIKKDEFQTIFECLNNILSLRITEDEYYKISKHYLKLLLADAKDGNIVNAKWFIEHIWYLCIGTSDEIDTTKYKDCIPFIQSQLFKQFNIAEKLNEKIKRKIYTRVLIK